MKLPNGQGTVYKVKGKRRKPFRVRATIGWDNEGRQIFKELGYAETYLAGVERLNIYHNNPYMIDNENTTLKDVYELWSKSKYPTICKSSVQGYVCAYNYCKEIELTPFSKIRVPLIQKIIDKAEGKLATQKKIRGLFSELYIYGMSNDIVNKNYADFVILGEQVKKILRVPFNDTELNLLWENVDKVAFVDTVLILIYTGMRINELLNMERENVHLDENYMIGGSKTKAGKNRLIPIHPRIKPLIEKWYNNSTSKYLIYNNANNKIDYTNYHGRSWADIMEMLGFNHKPHDTRHTFATRMDEAGADKLSIKLIMGHAIKDVTDSVYTHKTIDKLYNAVCLLK